MNKDKEINKESDKDIDKDMNKKKKISAAVIIAILAVAFVAVILVPKKSRQTAAEQFEELQQIVNESPAEQAKGQEASAGKTADTDNSAKDQPEDILEKLGIEIPQKNLDWDALHKVNADIYAWIYVPDTTVDYPVLQHPTDNSYYLDYNMDGSKGYPGCIYTENYNTKDFTDPHTVIYGHNLKDQTMFSSLHNFEDKDLVDEDHYIYIYTEDQVYVYQIFAAYDFDAIHLLANFDLTNEYVYEQYIKDMFRVPDFSTRVANFRTDIEVTRNDKILTLSTCTKDGNSDYRFLVVGLMLNPQTENWK